MKNILLCASLLCCTVITVATVHAETVVFNNGASVEACFSYTHTCEAVVVRLIQQAKQRLWLAGYGFTSNNIARAIRQAHAHGVNVRLVLDKSNLTDRYSQATYLARAGIDIRIDQRYAIMHHKLLIVDDTVSFGSMNFTKSADQKNAENFNTFYKAPALVRAYAMEFIRLYKESEPYHSKMRHSEPKRYLIKPIDLHEFFTKYYKFHSKD